MCLGQSKNMGLSKFKVVEGGSCGGGVVMGLSVYL